jgi:hypothetical protein
MRKNEDNGDSDYFELVGRFIENGLRGFLVDVLRVWDFWRKVDIL